MNRQILKDINTLLEEDVITPDVADKITAFYQAKDNQAPNRTGIALAVIGALLCGGGITLIVAHNWDAFSTFTKTIFAFLPLILAQILCVYTLLRQREKPVWRECSAALLFFSVGACLSLVSQIYQVSGSLSGFLLTWTLLCVPIVYVLSSTTAALLTIVFITWWACLRGYAEYPVSEPYAYLAVMALMIPYYISIYKRNTSGNSLLLMNYLAVPSILLVTATFLQSAEDWYPWIFAVYVLQCCIYYLIGLLPKFRDNIAMSRPFQLFGITGILFALFAWSFDSLWGSAGKDMHYARFFETPVPYLVILLIFVWYVLFRIIYKNKQDVTDHPFGFSAIIFIIAILFFPGFPIAGLLIINASIITIGVLYIRKGGNENHFGILNFGLMIIVALAICRFFDDSIPFTWRGIFFLVAGIGFFAGNYTLMKKRKQLKQTVTQ
jgi:uncharacterized membrane protein